VAVVIIAVLLLLLLLMSLFVVLRTGASADDEGGFSLFWDPDAQEGEVTQKTQEEIQAELNRQVEEGMICISMNSAPVFASGTAKGDLLIVNDKSNRYPQVVYILRQDTGEEIYRSGAIAVGSKIEQAALDVDLAPGTYDCVAYFNNVDPDTGEFLGTAGAEIQITVQS
jgi:hypothetical protein